MHDRHAIITGATGGLGSAVAPMVLSRGARLVIPYRSTASLETMKGRFAGAELSRVTFVQADLADEASVASLFAASERVDVLIHLVGGFSMGPTTEVTLERWHSEIDLNLTSAFLACRQALRRMREHGYGRIVTVGSRAAVEPGAEMAAYSAAKAGVVALTRSIAEETKGSDITANCILPSTIDTAANRSAMGEAMAGHWVDPHLAAELVCFLASEKARDLRGSVIPIFGNA